MNAFPVDPAPIPLECKTAGAAIDLLRACLRACLRASYHPHGGQDARRDTPVTHTVWVMGTPAQLDAFTKTMKGRIL